MSDLITTENDNWDCENLAVLILRHQEADEDNREVYRVQKCRMKKELNDMEQDMKGKGMVKRRRIIKSIIDMSQQFEEPLKLREKINSQYARIRELNKLVDTTEEYWTQKVRAEMRDEYSIDRATLDVTKELNDSRKVNRRLMDVIANLEGKLDNINTNYVITPRDEAAQQAQNIAELTLSRKHMSGSKTEKQLRKKIKKLEKQIIILKSLNADTSSSDEESGTECEETTPS